MSKLKEVEDFCKFLKEHRIQYERPNDYHIQIQRVHNFYPSTTRYYNSDSGLKTAMPSYKDGNELLSFLAENTMVETGPKKHDGKTMASNATNILEEANDIVFNRAEEKERQYGDFKRSMMKAASFASMMCGKDILPADMYKCMIALKLSRISHKYSHDSALDAIAYLAGLDDLEKMFNKQIEDINEVFPDEK